MSNFHLQISGCLNFNDYSEAINWLSKASEQLCTVEYESLIIKLHKEFPRIFNRVDFNKYKGNIKSLDERKKEIEIALMNADYEHAGNIFSAYFTFKTYPEFFDNLTTYRKQNPIKELRSSLKKNLSPLEKELQLDIFSYLAHSDKPFYRRVQAGIANFYFTKDYDHDVTIIKGQQPGFARHLHWGHEFSREILSTELGESGSYGAVTLIGEFTPKENDLTNVSYLSLAGRDYFSSATDALTDKNSTLQKIDVENFMMMTEVIPTPSQMKAIYAEGNYVIDGPAGTGKSTSLLQKLLILTTQNSVKSEKILVLVKHDGLVGPFKKLLMDMKIQKTHIDSVANFLNQQFGKQFDDVSLAGLDEAESASNDLKEALNTLLNMNSPSENDIAHLPPSLVDQSLVSHAFNYYCQLLRDKERTSSMRSNRVSIVINDAENDFGFDNKVIDWLHTENSLDRKFYYLKGLKMSPYGIKKTRRLSSEYAEVRKILTSSDVDRSLLYRSILDNIEKEFISLESAVHGKDHLGTSRSLGDYIQSKINDALKIYKDDITLELTKKRGEALESDKKLVKLNQQISNLNELIKSTKQEIQSLAWGRALIVESDLHRRMVDLSANINSKNDVYQTIIIDEAQDVPSNYIELVSFYSKQLILAGDEAQKENINGLGKWSNLRDKTNFYPNDVLSIFKLRHNFRQAYELGNLSYNYRQLLLGNPIEDLEADYFENQKGFNIPSITSMERLNELVVAKLKYISERFVQKFPLVVISSDFYSQEKIKDELIAQGLKVSSGGDESSRMDVIVLVVNKIAGREFPVVISMLSNSMEDGTIYIILSRAKFDLTLIVPPDYHIDANLSRLIGNKMLIDGEI